MNRKYYIYYIIITIYIILYMKQYYIWNYIECNRIYIKNTIEYKNLNFYINSIK